MTDSTAKGGFKQFAMKDREAEAARQVAAQGGPRAPSAALPIVGQADGAGPDAPATRVDKTTTPPR